MPSFGDLFGEGTTANQLLVWGVLNQVLSTLMAPFMQELAELEWDSIPNVPITPEAMAEAVARNKVPDDEGQAEAIKSGISNSRFDALVDLATKAPDISSAFEAYRRGLIPSGAIGRDTPSLTQALRDQGIAEEWVGILEKLATSLPTGAQVMNALLEGQISRSEAQRRWVEAGEDPTWFQSAYDSNGQAPTPTQALELLNRGIIPESGSGPSSVSYEQAFLEGPWRNKWLPVFKALRVYLPPPRTVTALYHEGAITHDKAAEWLTKQGLEPEAVTAYLTQKEKTATTTERHLTKADVLDLLTLGIATPSEVTDLLVKLHYTRHDAAELVTLTQVRVATAAVKQATNKIRSLYLAGKLTAAEASKNLASLKVDGAAARTLLQTWDLEVGEHKRELSAAQVESAQYYGLITLDDAIERLVRMGYSREDAVLAIEVRNKGKITTTKPKG